MPRLSSLLTVAWTDVRAAWRQHRRRPAGAAGAIVTIALAIGVNTALLSVARQTLLRPVSMADADRVVFVWNSRTSLARETLTPGRALDFRRRAQALESAALLGHTSMTVTGLGPAERWSGASVSSSFFDVLGVPAAIGRTFQTHDSSRDSVVLTHRWWMQRFGGDRSIVGRPLMMNGRVRVVVGVMPADFFWPVITGTPTAAGGPDFWACAPPADVPEGPIPADADIARDRQAGYLRMVARLAPGASLTSAQAELTTIAADLGREFPATDAGHGVALVPLREQFFGAVRTPLLFLLLASGLVVTLACVNVANLLVVRLPGRAREFAVRIALGASRWRVASQLLVEGVVLAAIGGAAGIALGRLSFSTLASLAPAGVGRLDRLALDGAVLGGAAVAVLACGLVLGLVPAAIVWRARHATDLRTAGVGLQTRPRIRQALVASEVALAVALVVGASLFGESLLQLRRVDVGFETKRLLTFNVALTGERAEYMSKQVAFYEDMFRAIRAIPGVSSAGGAVTLPIGGDDFGAPMFAEGQPIPPAGQETRVGFQIVGAGWFETLGMPIVSGRDFTEQDRHRDQPVAIVNQTLANQLWPGQDPLGRRLRYERDPSKVWFTVVGVVRDIRHLGPQSQPRPEFYQPYYQYSLSFLAVAVRAQGDAHALVPAIRDAVAALDPALPIYGVNTMDAHLSRAYGDERFLATLTLTFGALALGLAVVGVYGVVGWSSAQRSREFGLRTALGATPASLSGLVLTQGLKPVLIGAVLGAGLALVLSRSARSLLFETAPADPRLYAIAIGAVLAAAAVACWIPARRASRTDPVRALAAEP